jgi:hypothetical protein
MERLTREKINKETFDLNNTLDLTDLRHLRMFCIQTAFLQKKKKTGYEFFPSIHRTFSRTDYMLGCKASLSKFKRIEFISIIMALSGHNSMILEINNEKFQKIQQHTEV